MTYQDVENARKEYLSRIHKQIAITVVVVLALLLPFLISYGVPSGFYLIIFIFVALIWGGLIVLVICSFANRKIREEYRRAYKAYFVEQSLRSAFTDLEYSHDIGMPRSLLINTGMINTGDRYSSNDFVKATYKDVDFSQADVHIEVEHRDSDGDTSYATIFKGRFMIFEFPKQFSFRLALVGNRFGAFRRPFEKNGRKMEKISTESPEFNKLLTTYAEDGFEAFYLLDPKTIATVEDLTLKHDSRIVYLFYNNQLIIGLSNGKDSFEPPRLSYPIDEEAEKTKVGSDIKIITEFVDSLSLNRKLFKNETQNTKSKKAS